MIDKSIISALQSLGLTPKQVKFFQTSVQLGPSTINEIAKSAKLERSTAYLIVQELLDKGLLEQDLTPYRRRIYPVEPKTILRMLSAKQRQLRRQEIELEEKLPEIEALYQNSEVRPAVRVFQGKKGLLQIWQNILSTKGEILLWSNQERETLVFSPEDHQKFINERISKKIAIRVLAANNQLGKQLKEQAGLLRQTKLLPKDVTFSAETYIYDNKVAIIDYNKDIIGVIMESQPISDSQRAIFEMNWKLAS